MNEIKKPSLLIVEDDERFLETLRLEFQERGYAVIAVSTLREIQSKGIENLQFALVDLRLSKEDGLDIIEWLHEVFPNCRIVVMTGYGSISTAIQAVKRGATNYVTKPVRADHLEQAFWSNHESLSEENGKNVKGESLARHEREYIEYVVTQCSGNITQAAKWLGIHRQSLQRKMRKFSPLR